MSSSEQISHLCNQLRLTPYQSYILAHNSKKYDLGRLVKRGNVLYAPYLYNDRNNISDYMARIMFGPRADLIGPDKMLVNDMRGIKIYSNGMYSLNKKGAKYLINPAQNLFEHGIAR